MSIGIALPALASDLAASDNAVEFLIEQARRAAALGIGRVWVSQRFDVDALTVATIIGREVPEVAVGTSVVPIYPRHPLVLAAQAQTAQAATGGRFTLGLGLSGKWVEHLFGVPYDRPIRHLRDYLTVLHAVFGSGEAALRGPTLVANTPGPAAARVPGAQPPPILVAAMGPQALRAAGELADGTLPYLAGPKTLAGHIVPSIARAAAAAGRRPPRIVVALPAVVAGDVEKVRARAAEELAFYGTIPSYQAVLAREGIGHPVELAAIGDEAAVAAELRRYFDAGATELVVTNTSLGTPEDQERTWSLLAELSRSAAGRA